MRWLTLIALGVMGGQALAANYSTRIIGGTQAPASSWQSTVQLIEDISDDPAYGFSCGGSLLNAYYVLTAAHCVYDLNGYVLAPAQLYTLTGSNGVLGEGTRHDVKSITVHPDYNADTSDYDLALITLETPVENGAYMSLYDGVPAAGTNAIAVGWGLTSNTDVDATANLRQVTLPIVAQAECKSAMAPNTISSRMICAGDGLGAKDTCSGDSGGPLMVMQDGVFKQVGVTSWGADDCALKDTYGVYSRLSEFGDWINSVFADEGYLVDLVPVVESTPQEDTSNPPREASTGGGVLGLGVFPLMTFAACVRVRRKR